MKFAFYNKDDWYVPVTEYKLFGIFRHENKWFVKATGGAVFGWFMTFEDALYWYAKRFCK